MAFSFVSLRDVEYQVIIIIHGALMASIRGQECPEVSPAAFAGGLALAGRHVIDDHVCRGDLSKLFVVTDCKIQMSMLFPEC